MTNAAGDFTPNLGFGLILPGQAQKHLSVNEAFCALDTLILPACLIATYQAESGIGASYPWVEDVRALTRTTLTVLL
jgi:hypothetical protein